MTKIKGKIKAVSGPREFEGVMQIGFVLEQDPKKWYNINGTEDMLKEILEKMIKKGNEIEFDEDANKNVTNMKLIKEAPKKEGKWEDDIVNFETLLTAAHKKAKEDKVNLSMISNVVRDKEGKPMIDLEKKFALFKSEVVLTDGEGKEIQRFEGHGDTQESNIEGNTAKHWIRIAETRAKVRSLRWYTNNASVAEEEK